MPMVHIKVTGGDQAPSQEQKDQLIKESTDMLVRILGKNPDTTIVLIEEVSTDNWGIGGESVTKRLKNQAN